MNAPPPNPPIIFKYSGFAHLKALACLILFGGVLIVALINITKLIGYGKPVPIAILAPCLIIDVPAIIISWYLFFNRWGGRVEIREGMIKMLRSNGSTWMGCNFSSVTKLEYTVPKGESVPNMYFLKVGKGAVIFNPDVYPVNLTFLTGSLTEEEMRDEHPDELRRLKEQQRDTAE